MKRWLPWVCVTLVLSGAAYRFYIVSEKAEKAGTPSPRGHQPPPPEAPLVLSPPPRPPDFVPIALPSLPPPEASRQVVQEYVESLRGLARRYDLTSVAGDSEEARAEVARRYYIQCQISERIQEVKRQVSHEHQRQLEEDRLRFVAECTANYEAWQRQRILNPVQGQPLVPPPELGAPAVVEPGQKR